jgi:hypothetical protein
VSDEALCANCGKNPGTLDWVGDGGVLALTHGWVAKWCEPCCLKVQIKHAEERAAELPKMRARLAELEPATPPPPETAVCATWCGTEAGPTYEPRVYETNTHDYCTAACRDAGRSLRPDERCVSLIGFTTTNPGPAKACALKRGHDGPHRDPFEGEFTFTVPQPHTETPASQGTWTETLHAETSRALHGNPAECLARDHGACDFEDCKLSSTRGGTGTRKP